VNKLGSECGQQVAVRAKLWKAVKKREEVTKWKQFERRGHKQNQLQYHGKMERGPARPVCKYFQSGMTHSFFHIHKH